ncbi:protein YciW [Enterobacter asburiae]|uniref:Protein YciW n=1 Tax=Enterobacter asburiae TaxID=61645 RepID=A0A376FAW4_ENTAS|nr:protein YciW [Enterobacter asburiae]
MGFSGSVTITPPSSPPLPGPDSSRESNRRLAQITQYARQLASSPDVIDDKAQNQLDEVGLSTYDIVVISQIIGFIGFQARVVAIFQALLGHPVRWLPGHHIQPQTLPASHAAWVPLLPVVELRYASAHQLESLSRWQAEPALEALTPVLCHEPSLLDLTGEILLNTREAIPLTSPALSAAVELLTRSPDRFSAAQFTPLTDQGLPGEHAIMLLTRSAFDGWLNRLKVAFGKEE